MRAASPTALTENAVLGQVQFAEMTIAVGQVDAQRLLGLRPAASHFGQPELEAVGAVYANTMFRLGDGIAIGSPRDST